MQDMRASNIDRHYIEDNQMKQLVSSLFVLAFLSPMSALADKVRCESKQGQLKECEMNTRGVVRMTKQHSHTDCVEGVNWGLVVTF